MSVKLFRRYVRPRCLTCPAVLSKQCRHRTCPDCRARAKQRAPRRFSAQPMKARQIAGYVPPKGSIAAMFLGQVIRYA